MEDLFIGNPPVLDLWGGLSITHPYAAVSVAVQRKAWKSLWLLGVFGSKANRVSTQGTSAQHSKLGACLTPASL